jgi:glycosyltransferase involved in cell wall biosynthesis
MNMYRVARYLTERGHSVTLITLPGTLLQRYAEKAGLVVEPLVVKVKYVDLGAAYRLSALLKQKNISALVFSIAKDTYLVGWTKWFFYPALRLFYYQQMQVGIPKKGPVQTLLYRSLAAWIAPLHGLADQVRDMTHMPPERIHVILQGIDVPVFLHARAKREEARRHFRLPDGAFVVGIVGRIDPMKGQEYLIKAVGRSVEAGKPFHALVVGQAVSGYAQHLQRLVAELDVAPFVHLHPYTDDPSLAYAAMDAFALASLQETYGMVTVEAMAAGLAVVGTRSGGTPELLGNGRYGVLVPPRDDEALAAGLAPADGSTGRTEALGRAAQAYAAATFPITAQLEALENLLAAGRRLQSLPGDFFNQLHDPAHAFFEAALPPAGSVLPRTALARLWPVLGEALRVEGNGNHFGPVKPDQRYLRDQRRDEAARFFVVVEVLAGRGVLQHHVTRLARHQELRSAGAARVAQRRLPFDEHHVGVLLLEAREEWRVLLRPTRSRWACSRR